MSNVFNIDYIPTDIWLEICSNLSIKSLYSLRATCKGLRTIVDDRSVWHSALSDLVEIKDAVYSREDLESMSAPELREASVRIVKVDRAFRSPKLPHKKAPIPASIDTSVCSDVALFPGGDRLLFLGQDGSLTVYRLDTGATVMSYPSLNDGWSHHVNIHGVHPTSLYSGYIAIVATAYNPEDHFADVLSRELRVYKYTRHSIEYMFLEQELHPDADPCFHLFYEQDKIRVTQLYPSSPSDARLIGVSTRTVENGRDTREDTHFCMAESLTFISIGWESLELLSPEYVLICPQGTPCTAHLIDITQASKLTETPTVLHPFWSSEFDSPLSCLGRSVVSVTKRLTSRHPAVRALLISKKRLYSLHIPMHDESSVRLTSTLVPEPPTPARIEYQIHGELNHGLVRMQHFSELSRHPGQRSRNLARTGLWSYTADYPLYPESHGDSPGYMRLDRETSSGRTLPEVQLGNTLRSFTSEGIEAESIEFGVDTVSGRLVHFAHLQMIDRPPGAAAIRRVEIIYTRLRWRVDRSIWMTRNAAAECTCSGDAQGGFGD